MSTPNEFYTDDETGHWSTTGDDYWSTSSAGAPRIPDADDDLFDGDTGQPVTPSELSPDDDWTPPPGVIIIG